MSRPDDRPPGAPIVDVHSHCVPVLDPDLVRLDPRLPRVGKRTESGAAQVVVDERPFRLVRAVAWDPDLRAVEMMETEVAAAVVSAMPELFMYHLPADRCAAYYTATNTWIADHTRLAPAPLAGLGVVPLQDPERAAAMLAEITDLGLLGVEVGSHVNGVSIGDPRFGEFFAETAYRGLAVFVHAHHPGTAGRHPDPRADLATTLPPEIAGAALGMIAHGLFARLPQVRVLLSHGGGGVFSSYHRLQWLWESDDELRAAIGTEPREAVRMFYYDSVVFGGPGLRSLIDAVGADRVCAGSDHPFLDRPAGAVLRAGALDAAETAQVAFGTAAQLFGPPLADLVSDRPRWKESS